MNYQELSQKIRQKYPGSYDDLDDRSLAQKIVQKYPEYSDTTFDDSPSMSAPPAQPSLLKQTFDAVQMGNPINVSKKVYEMGINLFNKAGERTAEKIGGSQTANRIFKGATPYVAAGAGTAVSMAPDIAMSFAGGVKPAPMLKSAPNFIERMGARNVNEAIGVGEQAVKKLGRGMPGTSFKANPAETAENLGLSLEKEGVLGNTPKATYDNVVSKLKEYGKAVGDAYNNIVSRGVKAEAPFEEATRPLVDEFVNLGDQAYPTNFQTSRIRNAYDKLLRLAKGNNGNLTLDHIDEVLDDTGKAMNVAQEGSDKYKIFSKIYATLADVRDSMVNKVADAAGDPTVTQNLKNANAGYSKFMRILPDASKKAAKYGLKGFNFSEPAKEIQNIARPFLAKGAVKTGRVLREVGEKVSNVAPVIPAVGAVSAKKVISDEKVREYLKKANGDKVEARRLAREEGWVW